MQRRLIFASVLCLLLAITGCSTKQSTFPSDGQHVVLSGIVYAFDGITARDGSKYVVFALHQHVGSVAVLVHGRPDLYEGDNITVSGTFYRTFSTPFMGCSWRGAFCGGDGTRTGTKRFQDVIVADSTSS